jgi:hypothetical protein
MDKILEMLNDTSAYGFTFELGALGKGTGPDKIMYPAQPLLKVTDVAKFDAAFPGVILAHSDGQSIRVHAQRIARDLVEAEHGVKPETVKVAEIQSICFGRVASRSGAKVTTVEVAMTTAQQAHFLAEMAEMDVDADEARAILTRIMEAK